MINYIERVGKVLAPNGQLSAESEQRLLAAVQELMDNGCLICRHNSNCSLPHHGLLTDSARPCTAYFLGDYEEFLTAMYQRHFPEHNWKEIFAGLDWESQKRAAFSAAIEAYAEVCNESL